MAIPLKKARNEIRVLARLEAEIQQIRTKMEKLAESRDFNFQDVEVIELSQRLDTLLNRYQEIKEESH